MCRALRQIRREILDKNAKLSIMAQELGNACSRLEAFARVQKSRKHVRLTANDLFVDTRRQMHARGIILSFPPPPAIFLSVWRRRAKLKLWVVLASDRAFPCEF
jgi:hypothetical protein